MFLFQKNNLQTYLRIGFASMHCRTMLSSTTSGYPTNNKTSQPFQAVCPQSKSCQSFVFPFIGIIVSPIQLSCSLLILILRHLIKERLRLAWKLLSLRLVSDTPEQINHTLVKQSIQEAQNHQSKPCLCKVYDLILLTPTGGQHEYT